MKTIQLKTFLHHFCDNKRKDKKYCFILGAGASKQSGIPTGGELVKKWIGEIDDRYDKKEIDEWMKEQNILRDDLAKDYSKIYDKRFELDPQDGFAYLEELMEGKEPSCGYSVLAQILSKLDHKIVITTNFDSLTEDALFIYTQKKPLIVGHEALANFIKPFGTRPVIVKIHRDLFFSPKSNQDGTKDLEMGFKKNLSSVFKYYTPIVIGYGGNDGSLMGFLESLEEIEGGIFWMHRKDNNGLNERIVKLIEKFGGVAIPIDGFDEFMIQLGSQLQFERLDKKIEELASQRAKTYREQIENVQQKESTDTDTKDALKNLVRRGEKDWWYYELKVRNEIDNEKKNEIYLEAIKTLPNSYELLTNYAVFLYETKKEYEKSDEFFRTAIEVSNGNAGCFINYAIFLYKTHKNYDKAEEFYKKALGIDPNNPKFLFNYAIFLQQIRKNYDKTEELYKKALDVSPNFSYGLGGYANFLSNIRRNFNKAEELYKKAMDINSDDANVIGNYGKLCIEINKDDQAKDLVNRSFELNKKIKNETLELELWFYRYAIFWEEYKEAKENIERLLDNGITSPGWSLNEVLKRAKEKGHPDYKSLEQFEHRITKE